MRDLAAAIIAARRCHEALVSERATIGTDMRPHHGAEADTRLRELANARGYFLTPIDDAAQAAVEGKAAAE